MLHYLLILLLLFVLSVQGTGVRTGHAADIVARVLGKILLQVEEHGEAWYVNPSDLTRHYLGRPTDALRIMRELGLGITNADLAKLPQAGEMYGGNLPLRRRLSGRILLQVEENGEAWYVNPKTLARYYLGRPADALRIMRELGLGISNADLEHIPPSYRDTITVRPPIASVIQLPSESSADDSTDAAALNIDEFLSWAKSRDVEIVGVQKSTNAFYYDGVKPGDLSKPHNVPNIGEVARGMYILPAHLLPVMAGKTLYLSQLRGRGYTVLGSWPEQGILAGMQRGVILEQPITKAQVVHEFAHILDYHGIRGMYDDPQTRFANLNNQRAQIFDVKESYNPNRSIPPPGYIDIYSSANDAENFAQHFAAYIFNAPEFRERAAAEALLAQKYEFLKTSIFGGREY